MKKIIIGGCALLATLQANAIEFALGATGGTFGYGGNITVGVNRYLNVRGWLLGAEMQLDEVGLDDFETEDVTYSGDIDLGAKALLVDYHPFAGKFRITAGLVSNDNEVNAVGNANNIQIGDDDRAKYSGEVAMRLDMSGSGGYLGFGWGNAVSDGQPFGLALDIGVATMDPEIDIKLTDIDGPGAASPELRAQSEARIAEEEQKANDELDEFDLYPVINLSLSYRF